MTAAVKIMETLKKNHLIMASTGKVKDFSETGIRMNTRTRLASVALGSKCKFKRVFEHNHGNKERADKNDVLEVTTVTMIIWTPVWGSICFHTEIVHAPQSSEKTILDSATDYPTSTGAGWGTGRRCSDEQSLSPQQNSAVGCLQGTETGYVSLTQTCAHLLPLPWLRLWWGAAPFTRLLVVLKFFLSLMETQQLSINPSCWPPSYLPNGPGRISALLTYLGGRQQGPLHCQTCVHDYISRQRKRWEVGNVERGENSLGEARGKSKGSCDITPLNLSFLSVRKPDHPHWGSAHLLLLTTQITPSEPSIPQLAGEAARSSSSPALFGKGSHPPLWLQLSNRRNAKSSESLPALSLSVTCIKPPTHTKIFTTSAQNQLMRCIPYEVVNKSHVDFATLLSLELTVMNCNGTGMPRYFACLSML